MILPILFFKFKVKLINPAAVDTCMIDSRKIVDISLSKFSLKKLKKHLQKHLELDLPHWHNFFVLSAVIFVDISSTCDPPKFNLSLTVSVIIFLKVH